MIKKITKTKITQVCSECGFSNIIDIDTLIVGTETGENIVVLPKCSCGAHEFLNRTFDNWGEHARIVNSLCHFLYKKGKIHPEAKEKLDRKKEKDNPKNKVNMSNWGDKDFLENKGGFIEK